MTTDIERQFFDTFGIPQLCCKEYITNCLKYGECEECKNYDSTFGTYPQITDRILLEIIAKICWTYRCTANDFDLYEVSTAKDLKEAVLKHAIELSKNDDYIYSSVQALFEEG